MSGPLTFGLHGGGPAEPIASTGRALVFVPVLDARKRRGDGEAEGPRREPSARLDEMVGLAAAIDLAVAGASLVPMSAIRPSTYFGKGKVEEIAVIVRTEEAELVVVDAPLSPVQQRNLEKAFGAKVLDRTGLILEIFGRRARTREGSMQVELAHLTYQKSRLVRSWTHLERQRGGFGFLGGPGETQIEADRRLIQERIVKIEKELVQVRRTRGLHRSARQRVPYPVVALVGYTNAGKSTLFNRMTRAEVLAADMLFATLDPTLRSIELPHGTKVILSDTVGFISELPTMLVAAFRATLEEVIEADVILHVRDVSHVDADAQASDVEGILTDLGVDPHDGKRLLEVWNKVDALPPERRTELEGAAERRAGERRPILVSALTGEGVDGLLAAIEARVAAGRVSLVVTVPATDGAGLNWLYTHAEVLDRKAGRNGATRVTVRIDPARAGMVRDRFAKVDDAA